MISRRVSPLARQVARQQQQEDLRIGQEERLDQVSVTEESLHQILVTENAKQVERTVQDQEQEAQSSRHQPLGEDSSPAATCPQAPECPVSKGSLHQSNMIPGLPGEDDSPHSNLPVWGRSPCM